MTDNSQLAIAARRRDWTSCAKGMFVSLFMCRNTDQRYIAQVSLHLYMQVWISKNGTEYEDVFKHILLNPINTRPLFPDIKGPLDPGDSEFENGLIEYHAGTYLRGHYVNRTIHFASAIRSAVLARQVSAWIEKNPEQYIRWKSRRPLNGPTFLTDESASLEGERGWLLVDSLLDIGIDVNRLRHTTHRISTHDVSKLYEQWERSNL